MRNPAYKEGNYGEMLRVLLRLAEQIFKNGTSLFRLMRLRTKIYILITHKTSLDTREENPICPVIKNSPSF